MLIGKEKMSGKITLVWLVFLIGWGQITIIEGKGKALFFRDSSSYHQRTDGINSREDQPIDTVKNPWEQKLISAVHLYLGKLVHHPPTSEQGLRRSDKPVIAATGEELDRLKNAWASSGVQYEVLAKRFGRADKAIEAGVFFPPEGGQHRSEEHTSELQSRPHLVCRLRLEKKTADERGAD